MGDATADMEAFVAIGSADFQDKSLEGLSLENMTRLDAIRTKDCSLRCKCAVWNRRNGPTDASGESLVQNLLCYKRSVPMASCLGLVAVQF